MTAHALSPAAAAALNAGDPPPTDAEALPPAAIAARQAANAAAALSLLIAGCYTPLASAEPHATAAQIETYTQTAINAATTIDALGAGVMMILFIIALIAAEFLLHVTGKKSFIKALFSRQNGYATHKDIDELRREIRELTDSINRLAAGICPAHSPQPVKIPPKGEK